ncbi:MAG: acetyl-CoA decarbonylase/synthase complex subunit delta [Actinobacteria bacterium]|nr:acetyl-CoA decarbonylase/synthase complex subunit delta [Actinomycetota bacterium]
MPVALPEVKETWSGKIVEVTLGAGPDKGGTRGRTVTVGGETALPFLHFEGQIPNRPVIAAEVSDRAPEDWSSLLTEAWGGVLEDPASWAARAEELGAEVIALSLDSAHPERGDTGAKEARATVRKVLEATSLPLIIYGPGQIDKDNEVLVAAAEEAKGERVALGNCEEKNYRTIVAAALANDQAVIAKTPIDVNLAKQLNVLIGDMGLARDRIIMDPTTGALGYGIEYTYSVMERVRLAALTGDAALQEPLLVTAGYEAWRAKEARTSEGVPAQWGDWNQRGLLWEANTSVTLLGTGADILVLRHPETISLVKYAVDELMKGV